MKKVFAVTLAALLLLSFAACGGSASGGGNGGTGGDAGATSFTWVQGADITSLDPMIGKETSAVSFTCNIFDTLMQKDDSGNPLPGLAESWENVDDLTWKFKIREGIKFHDGEIMDAEDVKFSLDRCIASPHVNYIVDFIDTVEQTGDYEIVITTKNPYAPILGNLAVPFAAILPKHLVEADNDAFVANPVGTGAYKFVEWKQGEGGKLEAFDDYWQGTPAIKNLEMRVVPEAAQRTIALETGEVDAAYDIPMNDVSKIQEKDDLQILDSPYLGMAYLAFNTNKAPFDNAKIRQAIRYAINEQEIIDAVRSGQGEVATSLIPPAAFGYISDVPTYEFDLEKAKSLMAEAGYADGFSCSMWVNENAERVEACTILQAQLKQIGIELTLEVMEFGSFIDRTSAAEHDIAYFSWTCATADADYNYNALYHSTQQGNPGNRSFVNDPEVDRLIEAGRGTANADERKAFYAELETIVEEQAFYAPIFYSNLNVGTKKSVQGFVMQPNGYHRYYTVSFAS